MGANVVAAVQSLAPDRVDGPVCYAAAPGHGTPPTDEDPALLLRDTPRAATPRCPGRSMSARDVAQARELALVRSCLVADR